MENSSSKKEPAKILIVKRRLRTHVCAECTESVGYHEGEQA